MLHIAALKAVFRPFWKGFEARFDHILPRIRSYGRLIEGKTRISYSHQGQYTMDAQEIRNYLGETERSKLLFKKAEKEKLEVRCNAVRGWIAGAEIENEHNSICRDRDSYPNSGEWIPENDRVRKWLSPDPEQSSISMLWINGHPGTGTIHYANYPLT
jgi:hypothetical protein